MPASTMSVFWLTRRLLPRSALQPLGGAVLTVTDSLPSTLPAPVQDPLLITGTGLPPAAGRRWGAPLAVPTAKHCAGASAAAAPEGEWHHDGAGDQRESE